MCGIAGILGRSESLRPPIQWLQGMAKSIAHRGPDGDGFFLEGTCGFAHRRLSIRDLTETGKQPMTSHNGLVTVVFNGELYNDDELRSSLHASGTRFRGSSDTEVLVELFARDGWDALPQFSGMFALAVWFHDRKELLLARDFAGIKPLYYSIQPAWFLFASEIPALLTTGLVPPDINEPAISQYVRHAQPAIGERTLWSHIRVLPPSGWLRVNHLGEVSHGFLWRPPTHIEEEYRNNDALVAHRLQELLSDETKRELKADVPVGAYLSGGVDSTILLAEVASVATSVRTFGIRFPDAGFDESRYAKLAASAFQVQHTQLTYSLDSYVDDWVQLVAQRGAPLTVPNEPPLKALAQAASQELKVVLTGEGSDELFGGYPLLSRAPFDFHRSKLLASNPELFGEAAETLTNALVSQYGRATFLSPLDHFTRAYRWIPVPLTAILFGLERARSIENDAYLDTFWREHFARTASLPYEEQAQTILWSVHLPGLLGRIDATTMAASIEGRVPFVSKKLVEFGLSLPLSQKLRFRSLEAEAQAFRLPASEISGKLDIAKYVLREAYKNRIPNSLRMRSKTSFPVPLEQWFSGRLRNTIRDRLIACAEKSHWFDRDGIEYLFSQALPPGSGIALWMALNLALFYDVRESLQTPQK
ncbi:MAG: asparagine synthase (glutamine-hydrolyzing) [bacterium]|nr:asparagine synthase (glutamine-hydrolyzing) [bacterium]